ncbi:MAG: Crp/Fnr family transcriptional regulator [Polyangiaceae bacterium]
MLPATWEALRPSLERVQLKQGRTLHAPNQTMRDVFFPIFSIISVVSEMSGGKTSEIGIIGRDGMSALAVALGRPSTTYRNIVQVPDSALSMPVQDFRAALLSNSELTSQALRYAQATLVSVSQSAACNRLHAVDERLARWLLMAHDRVEGDFIALTQEFVSQMLGVRRAGVTVAALALQEAGMISYARGRITIRNRKRLEETSCECYGMVEREWTKIMGYSPSKTLRQRVLAKRR